MKTVPTYYLYANAMKPSRRSRRALLVCCVCLAGCATGGSMVFYSFSFDTFSDDPNVEVLDYRYGRRDEPDSANRMGTSAMESRVRMGEVFSAKSTGGYMPKGDFLYVKWRLFPSRETYEDTVDLKTRLPGDISHHGIHFVVRQKQLYVYLVPPPGVWPAVSLINASSDPQAMAWLGKHQIYPDQ